MTSPLGSMPSSSSSPCYDASECSGVPSAPILDLNELDVGLDQQSIASASDFLQQYVIATDASLVQSEIRQKVRSIIAGAEAKRSLLQWFWDFIGVTLPVLGWALRFLFGKSQPELARESAQQEIDELKIRVGQLQSSQLHTDDAESMLDSCKVLLELFTVAAEFVNRNDDYYISKDSVQAILAAAKCFRRELFAISEDGSWRCAALENFEAFAGRLYRSLFDEMYNRVWEFTGNEIFALTNAVFDPKNRAFEDVARALEELCVTFAEQLDQQRGPDRLADSVQQPLAKTVRCTIMQYAQATIQRGVGIDLLMQRLRSLGMLVDDTLQWQLAMLALKFDSTELLEGLQEHLGLRISDNLPRLMEQALDCYPGDCALLEINYIKFSALEGAFRRFDLCEEVIAGIDSADPAVLLYAVPKALWLLPYDAMQRILCAFKDAYNDAENDLSNLELALEWSKNKQEWRTISEPIRAILQEAAAELGLSVKPLINHKINKAAITNCEGLLASYAFSLSNIRAIEPLLHKSVSKLAISNEAWRQLEHLTAASGQPLVEMCALGTFEASPRFREFVQSEIARYLNLIELDQTVLEVCRAVLTREQVPLAIAQRMDELEKEHLFSLWPKPSCQECVNPELAPQLEQWLRRQQNAVRHFEHALRDCLLQMAADVDASEQQQRLLLLFGDVTANDVSKLVGHWVSCVRGPKCLQGLQHFSDTFNQGVICKHTLNQGVQSKNWAAVGWLIVRSKGASFNTSIYFNMLDNEPGVDQGKVGELAQIFEQDTPLTAADLERADTILGHLECEVAASRQPLGYAGTNPELNKGMLFNSRAVDREWSAIPAFRSRLDMTDSGSFDPLSSPHYETGSDQSHSGSLRALRSPS